MKHVTSLKKDEMNQNDKLNIVVESQEFQKLLNAKKIFIIPMTIIFLTLYFILPILTSYTTILNHKAIGSISWTWIYAISLFIMTWTFCTMYVKKATRFDQMAKQVIEKYVDQGDNS